MSRYSSLKSQDAYNLFPGMASIMEDTDVEVNVEVSDDAAEDVAEDMAEQEVAEEATEATETSEQDDEAAEATMRKYMELENALNHVKQYGVDRSFVSLMNYDDTLGRVLRVSFPSVESMDATGDPYSKLSKNTIAGLEAVLQLCEKIINAFKKAATWVVDLFQGYERKLKALDKKITNSKNKDAKDIQSDAGGEKYTDVTAIAKLESETKNNNKNLHDLFNEFKAKVQSAIEGADEDDSKSKSEVKALTDKAGRTSVKENFEAYKRAYDKAKSSLKETKSLKDLATGDAKKVAGNLVEKGLTAWSDIKTLRADLDFATKCVQDVKMAIARMESKKQTKGRTRNIQFISKHLTLLQRMVMYEIQVQKDICSVCIKNASKIAKYCLEDEETD